MIRLNDDFESMLKRLNVTKKIENAKDNDSNFSHGNVSKIKLSNVIEFLIYNSIIQL